MDNHLIHNTYFNAEEQATQLKQDKTFRAYTKDTIQENIKQTYYLARSNQSVEHVRCMHKKYLTFSRLLTLEDVFEKLSSFVDISDPDISLPNYFHGIQTAEAIRKDGHPEWLQLVGLIHDIGKIMFQWGCDEDGTSVEKQWGIVGDTFVVGCALPDTLVYPEFNSHHPDNQHPVFSTKFGMYSPHCGLDNTLCSWGHDEYLYQVLKYNQCDLPQKALYIIRFHSLYAHHKERSYDHLMSEKDHDMLHWLRIFNSYDLYTKTDDNVEVTSVTKKYYNKLIHKYLNGGNLTF
jgi:inositol oxygenase